MSHPSTPDDFYVDANGCLTERRELEGVDVTVHYDDIPESDITSVDGIPCTTALRTLIDIAVDLDRPELERIVAECLDRGLFTPEEAFERVAQPDMLCRRGATLLARVLTGRNDAPG